jgi:5'(3')-deoxyribonucleotidase
MVRQYRRLLFSVAPPTMLVQLDGVLADVDKGFFLAWDRSRSSRISDSSDSDRSCDLDIDRARAPNIEQCFVSSERGAEAQALVRTKGFCRNLPEVPGAVAALQDMRAEGLRVLVVISTSRMHSAVTEAPDLLTEKMQWVAEYLGRDWLGAVTIAACTSAVRGDVLFDNQLQSVDSHGHHHHTASWKQIVVDAPYNQQEAAAAAATAAGAATGAAATGTPTATAAAAAPLLRLRDWKDWRSVLHRQLGLVLSGTALAPSHKAATTPPRPGNGSTTAAAAAKAAPVQPGAGSGSNGRDGNAVAVA